MPNNNGRLLRDTIIMHYVIRFGDYYTGDNGVRGRIVELATINQDNSYTYKDGYVSGDPRMSAIDLFNNQGISKIVNSLNVYDPQADGDQFRRIPFLQLGDGDIMSVGHEFDGRIKEINNNTYFALDPNWNNDVESSSTTRVQIAQGQSDITRHESYFKEEMSPNYKFQKELPKYFVYRRITADENTAMNTTRSGTKASGKTYLNGVREDICGRYFETDEEYPSSDYVHVCSRYIYDKGTPQERVVYSWKYNVPIFIPVCAKIEVDIPSLNNMEYINPESQEVAVKKGEWYKALDMLYNNAAFIDENNPQINEMMAAKPLSTLKEHIANVHIYGRDVNSAIGLAIEPGTDVYCYTDGEEDVNYANVTQLTSFVVPNNNKYYFYSGDIIPNGTIFEINVDYGQSIDEYDITADTVIWNKEAMSLDNYQQLPHGDLLAEAYTVNFIWHIPYGYDKHNGDNLGKARNMIREALVEKGANVSGIGELKLFSRRTIDGGEGEDPINGPLVLVDNADKKFGLVTIDIDGRNEDYLAVHLYGASCPYDEHAITDGAILGIESLYDYDMYSEVYDTSVSHESIINAIKNTIPYDELYEEEEPITLPDCENCGIYLEKY